MSQRIGFGALLILALAAVFWGDVLLAERAGHRLLRSGSLIPLTVFIVAVLGSRECLQLAAACGHQPLRAAVYAGVCALHLIAAAAGWLQMHAQGPADWLLSAVGLCVLLIGAAQVVRRRTEGGIGDMAVSLMVVLYMGLLPALMTLLRTGLPGRVGAWAVLLFLAVVKAGDIGAYFAGTLAGRTKLIPAISPGKTVEGLIGGAVLAIAVAMALGRWLPWEQAGAPPWSGWFRPVAFGLAMTAAGLAGDLTESILKRQAAVKDSAAMIPSFGGVLDLLDSPALAAPLGYVLLDAWLR